MWQDVHRLQYKGNICCSSFIRRRSCLTICTTAFLMMMSVTISRKEEALGNRRREFGAKVHMTRLRGGLSMSDVKLPTLPRFSRPRLNFTSPRLLDAVAGTVAGAVSSTVTCPLDVLKTRLQVQSRQFSGNVGIIHGVTRIVEKEGVRGLYTGIRPTIIALLPNWAAYFPVYTAAKSYLSEKMPDRPSAVNSLAALTGGAAALAASNPFWVAKTRLQTQVLALSIAKNAKGVPYKGPFDCITRIAREEGFGGLYSGVAASIFGLAHVAIQFPVYELLKQKFGECDVSSSSQDGRFSSMRHQISSLMTASALSKLVASTCTYPHEVVRSQMQVAGISGFGGLGRACKRVFMEDGLAGFYRGYTINLVRTIPTAAVTLPTYELVRGGLENLAVALAGDDQPSA